MITKLFITENPGQSIQCIQYYIMLNQNTEANKMQTLKHIKRLYQTWGLLQLIYYYYYYFQSLILLLLLLLQHFTVYYYYYYYYWGVYYYYYYYYFNQRVHVGRIYMTHFTAGMVLPAYFIHIKTYML